jgi:hypothetical protein
LLMEELTFDAHGRASSKTRASVRRRRPLAR